MINFCCLFSVIASSSDSDSDHKSLGDYQNFNKMLVKIKENSPDIFEKQTTSPLKITDSIDQNTQNPMDPSDFLNLNNTINSLLYINPKLKEFQKNNKTSYKQKDKNSFLANMQQRIQETRMTRKLDTLDWIKFFNKYKNFWKQDMKNVFDWLDNYQEINVNEKNAKKMIFDIILFIDFLTSRFIDGFILLIELMNQNNIKDLLKNENAQNSFIKMFELVYFLNKLDDNINEKDFKKKNLFYRNIESFLNHVFGGGIGHDYHIVTLCGNLLESKKSIQENFRESMIHLVAYDDILKTQQKKPIEIIQEESDNELENSDTTTSANELDNESESNQSESNQSESKEQEIIQELKPTNYNTPTNIPRYKFVFRTVNDQSLSYLQDFKNMKKRIEQINWFTTISKKKYIKIDDWESYKTKNQKKDINNLAYLFHLSTYLYQPYHDRNIKFANFIQDDYYTFEILKSKIQQRIQKTTQNKNLLAKYQDFWKQDMEDVFYFEDTYQDLFPNERIFVEIITKEKKDEDIVRYFINFIDFLTSEFIQGITEIDSYSHTDLLQNEKIQDSFVHIFELAYFYKKIQTYQGQDNLFCRTIDNFIKKINESEIGQKYEIGESFDFLILQTDKDDIENIKTEFINKFILNKKTQQNKKEEPEKEYKKQNNEQIKKQNQEWTEQIEKLNQTAEANQIKQQKIEKPKTVKKAENNISAQITSNTDNIKTAEKQPENEGYIDQIYKILLPTGGMMVGSMVPEFTKQILRNPDQDKKTDKKSSWWNKLTKRFRRKN